MIAPPLVHHGPAATSQEGWAGGWFQCPMNMSQKFVSFSIDKSFLVLVLGPWSLSQLLSGLPGVPAAAAAAGRGAYPEGERTTLYVIALQGHWSVLSSPVKHMQFFHSNLQKSVPQTVPETIPDPQTTLSGTHLFQLSQYSTSIRC